MNQLINEVKDLNQEYLQQNMKLLTMLEAIMKKSKSTQQIQIVNTSITKPNSIAMLKSIPNKQSRPNTSSTKTIRKCGSYSTIKKKPSFDSTINTSNKCPKKQHEDNMMKLKKLSSRVIPKVSNNWLYKNKSKILHFQ